MTLTDQQRVEINDRRARYLSSHAHMNAFACCTAHASADDVPLLLERLSRLEATLESADDLPARIAKQALAGEDQLNERLAQAEAENGRLTAELAAAREPIGVDDLARLLHEADVFVNKGDYPSWDDLSTTPGLGQDEVRKAARYLLRRLNINRHRLANEEG